MKNQIFASVLPLAVGIGLLFSLCAIGIPAFANQDWVEVHGTVRYDGAPVCAMVLINGQSMFSCKSGDEFGQYRLQVPLDSRSEITTQAFVAGLAPFRLTTDASDLNIDIEMQATDPESKSPAITISSVPDDSTPSGWARIAGTVSLAGGSLCGLVLANGQYMFSCGESQGRYDLTVPLDENGEITLLVNVSGLLPYRKKFEPVPPQTIDKDAFTSQGDTLPLGNGYRSVGTLIFDAAGLEQSFTNADLVLEFDEEGNLVDLLGESDLPASISNNISVDTGAKAVVGLKTGEEINADDDFGITLLPERKYFVYYLGASLTVTIQDRFLPGNLEPLTIEPPVGGEIIMIADPLDSFLYRFSGTPAGDYGYGESDNGLIPYEPVLGFTGLDAFNGHIIEKGAMSVGVKWFDFFEIGGTRVIKEPQFSDINWDDPFESAIEYRAGMNGFADFAFSIVNVGLFSFELAQTSATLDVGFDRQHMAMALSLAPDLSWVPAWFHLQPQTSATGSASIDGAGNFLMELEAGWKSELPEADVTGRLEIVNAGVTLEGSTVAEGDRLNVSMAFANDTTVGRVEFPERYSEDIKMLVSEALDRELAAVQTAIQDLEDAVANYEIEVSLRGLRKSLPSITDAVVSTLNSIPGIVRDRAEKAALDKMASTCKTVDLGILGKIKKCIDDIVDEKKIADDVGDIAYDEAADAIVSPKAAMQELKRRAQEDDDETLRDALRAALDQAYANRTFKKTITVKKSFGSPFNTSYTLYSQTYEKVVLDSATAERILEARDNVHLIQETSDIVISSQAIVNQLPTEEVISKVRQEVEDGITTIPTVEGLGYRAIENRYEAFVTVDGIDRDIQINVLKPSEVREGVSDLLADLLLN